MENGRRCQLKSCSEQETEQIGRKISTLLQAGSLVLLNGDLGAGKTVMARGIIRGLGVDDPYITSPTFTLMNTYTAGHLPVYHFDLYRLNTPDELGLTGTDEYLEGDGVSLVEWAEKGGDWIPADHLLVNIYHQEDQPERRLIELDATGFRSREVFDEFKQQFFN
ncbi:MAG: tRNA (adenosine(37)-N6)-threonylcarbamoyltransferase complex ATPase subunit type 1 TsaE [Magnetococcales bacterium]|nr:tRNA (adenosine(37)-N6)-threonylcarbamoyltransferase complex ATPase subunit type 1 TsaE [Magnetococcales bacterium]